MVRTDPYAPTDEKRYECQECGHRFVTAEPAGTCPECGGYLHNLAVARE